MRATLTRVLRMLRDGWAVAGLTVVLLLGLEGAYRAQASLRRALRGEPTVPPVPADHPYAGESWWRDWLAGGGSWNAGYDPYRGSWPGPVSGPLLNIDTLGHRLTVGSGPGADQPRFRIFMFGGSTMFGYTARDAWTIPSQLALLLEERGLHDVEVVNVAQSTFNVMQNLNSLVLELRAGRVPDAVVFLDGNNEVAPAFQSGRPGGILNQELIARRVQAEPPSIPERLAGSLSFVQRLMEFVGPRGADTVALAEPAPEQICPGVAEGYLRTLDVVEGIGAAFDFRPFFFWQPMLATTGKTLTPFERSVRLTNGWGRAVAECTIEVRTRAVARGADRPTFLDGLFDERVETVFLDDFGHVTETGNRRIAEAILERMLPVLQEATKTD